MRALIHFNLKNRRWRCIRKLISIAKKSGLIFIELTREGDASGRSPAQGKCYCRRTPNDNKKKWKINYQPTKKKDYKKEGIGMRERERKRERERESVEGKRRRGLCSSESNGKRYAMSAERHQQAAEAAVVARHTATARHGIHTNNSVKIWAANLPCWDARCPSHVPQRRGAASLPSFANSCALILRDNNRILLVSVNHSPLVSFGFFSKRYGERFPTPHLHIIDISLTTGTTTRYPNGSFLITVRENQYHTHYSNH